MNMDNFISGLGILEQAFNDPAGCHMVSEHEEFYVNRTDRPLSAEDVSELKRLGWSQPDLRRDSIVAYDPAMSWMARI